MLPNPVTQLRELPSDVFDRLIIYALLMALPPDVQKLAEDLLKQFCDERVPEEFREQVRLLFKVTSQSITLIEERPHYRKPLLWTLSPVAQFRYVISTKLWTLYCRDRNQKWWEFTPRPPSRDIQVLIDAVDRDETYIFWG